MKKSILLQETSKSRKTKLKSLGWPTLTMMFANANQMTSSKTVELKKQIEAEKPLIVAVCEVKQKNTAEISEMDYDIPGYPIHPINLDNDTGRGIEIYSKDALDKSVLQIDNDPSFEEVCLIEVRLRSGDIFFGCVYSKSNIVWLLQTKQFFFSLCIFSQVRNIPERIILISTTGLRWRDYTHKHLTYNRYQSH